MSVSVIIPVFDRAEELVRAVNSVINQTTAVNEIIIIDDGSNDATPSVIKKLQHDNPVLIKSIKQYNQGVSSARNRGLKIAQSEWIAFLDSDDEWLPNKIFSFYQYLEHQPNCQFFHSDEIWIRNGVRVNAMKKHQKRGGMIFNHCLPLCVISPSASIIHQTIFKQVGLFDEELPACEDYDLWLRICHQFPVYYSEEMLIRKYGGHADQLSAKYWGMDRFRITALNKLLKQKLLNENDEMSAIAMLCKKTKILLKGAKKHNNEAIIHKFSPILEKYHCV